jgi:phage shock protein A
MTRFAGTSAMMVCLLAASSSQVDVEAFAPSFVANRHTLPATFGVAPSFTSSRGTALQMNLFDRFSRVAKSNLNNILQKLEDPEKIMTQALEDMQVRTEREGMNHICE